MCLCVRARACVGGNYITVVVWQKNKSQTEAAFVFKKMQINHTPHAKKAEFIDTQIWQCELLVVAEKHEKKQKKNIISFSRAPNHP